MSEKKFQKQKLNKEDHKKVDDTAKNVRNGIGIGGTLLAVGVVAIKFVPKVIKTIRKA